MEEQPRAQQVDMIVNPNEQMLQYMQLNSDFMHNLSRQLTANDTASCIPVFSGGNAKQFREWIKTLDRIYIDNQDDHVIMGKLITKTTRDLAADFYADLKRDAEAPLSWPETRDAFYARFSNYVDAHIAQQTLKTLKQERKQDLHCYAQKISETARDAYTPDELNNPIVIRELKNIFIDGLRQKKTAQLLIQEDVPNLQAALARAIRQELLQQTFQLRQVNTFDNDRRDIVNMEVDQVDQNNAELGTQPSVTPEQWTEMTNQVAAIASAVKQIPTSYNASHTRNDHNYNKPTHQAYNENKWRYPSHYSRTNHLTPSYNKPPPSQQYRSANNSALIRPATNFVRKPLRWAPNGDPICSFCDKQGHMRRMCWARYPEQKPVNYRASNNNNNRPQHAPPKN